MIVTSRTGGLDRLRNRLKVIRSLAGLEDVLREGGARVRRAALDNLSARDLPGQEHGDVSQSLHIDKLAVGIGYTVGTANAAAADHEFGHGNRDESRWLGMALVQSRKSILASIRAYLRALIR